MKKLATLIFLISLITNVLAQDYQDSCYKVITADQLVELQFSESIIIVDVRTKSEFKKERIQGAILADSKKDLNKLLDKTDSSKSIIVYCTKGVRSKKAAKYLCSLNKSHKIYNYSEGITEWRKLDYPMKSRK